MRNTTGNDNTANGGNALINNTGGSKQCRRRFSCTLQQHHRGNNIALGANAGSNLTTGSDNIDIGNCGVAGDSGTMRFGDIQKLTFIAGIYNTNEGGTIKPVYINSNGQLGTQPPASSARFKDHIKPMDKTSEAILGLKPVTFHYKSDNNAIPQFGLIAEDVANVNPALVVRDDKGEIYTVRYEAVTAMLLNEFLKEHRRVANQQSIIAELKATVAKQQDAFTSKIAQQQKQIDALTTGLQKVTAQVEAGNSAPRVASDN